MTASSNKLKRANFIPDTVRKPVLTSWIIAIVITLISTVYYFLSQPQLPILYSLARKSDQIVQKEFIFLFPIISILMNLLHLLVIKTLKKYSSLMLKLFVFTTTAIQAIFLLSLIRIVMITS